MVLNNPTAQRGYLALTFPQEFEKVIEAFFTKSVPEPPLLGNLERDVIHHALHSVIYVFHGAISKLLWNLG